MGLLILVALALLVVIPFLLGLIDVFIFMSGCGFLIILFVLLVVDNDEPWKRD